MVKFHEYWDRIWSRPVGDVVNLVAAVIGIVGFITGIPSIPVWIAMNSGVSQPTTSVAWFSPQIPVAISVPVFVLSLLFVFGLYFALLVRVYRRLYLMRIIAAPASRLYAVSSRDRAPADTFIIVFVVCVGAVIAFVFGFMFFGDSLVSMLELAVAPGRSPNLAVLVLLIMAGTVVFLVLLCKGARDAGLRQEIAVQPKRRY